MFESKNINDMVSKVTLLLASLLAATGSPAATKTQGQAKVSAKQSAPTFTAQSLSGTTVNLADYRGKKVLLSFYRNAGCPVCNLRFHQLQEQAALFQSKGLVVLAVYESSADKMKQYVEGETYYATILPDPALNLYQLYGIELSMGKVMKGMFHGAMGKMSQGKKLFKSKIKQDGNSNRIGADFLIDENGKVVTAHYDRYIGDELPVADIIKFIN